MLISQYSIENGMFGNEPLIVWYITNILCKTRNAY